MNIRDDLNDDSAPSSPPDDWALQLTRYAARRAPGELAERLDEEWLADLDMHRGPFARLRFALGCCRATHVIAREPAAYGVATTPVAVPAVAIADAAPSLRRGGSSRSLLLFFIAFLHLLIIVAFSTGIHVRDTDRESYTPTGRVIIKPRPAEPPPPYTGPSDSDFAPREKPNPQLPAFDPIAFPEDTSTPPLPTGIGTNLSSAEPTGITRVIGGPGAGFPGTAHFYPALSRQLGEAGAATVDVCVDTRGRLTGEPQIRTSSGFPRLDAGALALAKAGSGRYRSTTENGQPISACYPFRIRFALTH